MNFASYFDVFLTLSKVISFLCSLCNHLVNNHMPFQYCMTAKGDSGMEEGAKTQYFFCFLLKHRSLYQIYIGLVKVIKNYYIEPVKL